jgi:5-methyltetrahydrofolate--homocysteine methyltransferase
MISLPPHSGHRRRYGTMIQSYRLDEAGYRGAEFRDHPRTLKGANDLLSLTQPGIIEEIHRKYLEAGADVIETNTFNGTSISMADYGLEPQVYEINRRAAEIARRAADDFTRRNPQKPRFVAGSMGPTTRTASISPDVTNPAFRGVTFDELESAFYEQARGPDGGVFSSRRRSSTPEHQSGAFRDPEAFRERAMTVR